MYSNRRRPLTSTTSSFTSFTSDSSYRPRYRRPSPVAFRQLVVRDLEGTRSLSRDRQTQSDQTPRLILPIPRPSIHIPRENSLERLDNRRPTYINEFSSIPNPPLRPALSERSFYQIVPARPPTPPAPLAPPPPPPPPNQYRFIPVLFERPLSIRRKRQKKYLQEKPPGLCATLCSGGFATIAVLIYLTIAFALPITKLVLGILYINECPVNKNIPIYMIVSGACGITLLLLLLLSSTCTYYRASTIAKKSTHRFIIGIIALARGMQGVLAIFLFIWFFVGNFWVFGARQRVQTNISNSDTYCQANLYWFAFYVLIFTYVYAMFMCMLKFCTNFLCCGAFDVWKRAFS